MRGRERLMKRKWQIQDGESRTESGGDGIQRGELSAWAHEAVQNIHICHQLVSTQGMWYSAEVNDQHLQNVRMKNKENFDKEVLCANV